MKVTVDSAGGSDDLLLKKLSNSHIPCLDGIRAVCVSAVILGHLPFFQSAGPQGVSTFFVLSGFLITWLLLREQERTGTVSLRNFYIRRALRLLPAFYVFWAIYVFLDVTVQHGSAWGQYLAAALYFSNYFAILFQPAHMAMAHIWSLGVEEQFYFLWPCAFICFSQNRRRLGYFLGCSILFIWVYRIVLYHLGASSVHLECSFDTRADQLAVGCLMAVLLTNADVRATALKLSGYSISIVSVILFALSVKLDWTLGKKYTFQAGYCVEGVLAAIIILQAVILSKSKLWAWLEVAPLRYIGTISYPIYLYHWMTNKLVMTHAAPLGVPFQIVLAFTLAIIAASISYFGVEQRFLRMKGRFITDRNRERVSAVLTA